MRFSRRQLLVTAISSTPLIAAIATPTLSSNPAPATTAAPQPPSATILPGEVKTFEIPSGDFSTRRALAYSFSEQVQFTQPGEFRVVVRYDGRLFNATDGAVAAHQDRYEFVSTTISEQHSPEHSIVSYNVPDISDGDPTPLISVDVPLTVRNNYPCENLDDPLPITLAILDEAGAELAKIEWIPAEATAAGSVWGVELAATWDSVTTKDALKGTKYRYPISVICASVGPASTPVGAVLAIDMDARLLTSCSVTRITPVPKQLLVDEVSKKPVVVVPWESSAFDASEATNEQHRILNVTLNQAIEAGSSIEVSLSVSAPNSVPTVSSIVYASAKLSGPGDAETWARTTGKFLVTDLTDSGSPQVSDVSEGKI